MFHRGGDSLKGKLFSQYEHNFKILGDVEIIKISASVGKVYDIQDHSFKYKLNAPVNKGSISLRIEYKLGGSKKEDRFVYHLVPKARYFCRLTNLKGSEPTASEISKDSIIFKFFLDNEVINAELLCCTIFHLPKRGDAPPSYLCCKGTNSNNGHDCIKQMQIDIGDKIFLGEIIFRYNGKKIKCEKEISILVRN